MLFSQYNPAAHEACCIIRQLRVTQMTQDKLISDGQRNATKLLHEASDILNQFREESSIDLEKRQMYETMQELLQKMRTLELTLASLVSSLNPLTLKTDTASMTDQHITFCDSTQTNIDNIIVIEQMSNNEDDNDDTEDPGWDSCEDEFVEAYDYNMMESRTVRR